MRNAVIWQRYFMIKFNQKKLIFFILFSPSILFPQSSNNLVTKILYDSTYQINISSQLPPLTGKFKIYELQNGESYSSVYNIQFFNSKDNTLFCAIIDTIFDFTYWPDFELADINFDGFKDVWTIIHRDVKAQPSYHFWIFNPQKHSFQLNKMFTDLLVCNLEINSEDSTISSGCQGGCMGFCGSEMIYKVSNNCLVLIESNESEQVEINGESKIQYTVRKLINGKMKVTEESYSDYP